MYSLNAANGEVAWSQMIGYSQGASVFVNKAFSAAADGRGGYEISVWFEGPYEDGDNLIFLIKGMATGDPVTLERKESEGFLSINTNTGKVNYQAKFRILPKKPGKGYAILGVGALNDLNDGYPEAIEIGNTIIAAGDESLVAVDKSSGQIKWQTQTPGLVTDLNEQDGALVAQIGKMVVSTAMDDKGKMKTKSTGAKPFGFAVIDVGSGSIKWSNTEFKVDPTLAMAGHVSDNVLYGCDGEKLYALSLSDGKFKWQFDIKKEGKAGKITGDKAWAVKVEKSSFSGFGSTTTTTTWSFHRLRRQGDHPRRQGRDPRLDPCMEVRQRPEESAVRSYLRRRQRRHRLRLQRLSRHRRQDRRGQVGGQGCQRGVLPGDRRPVGGRAQGQGERLFSEIAIAG